MSLRRILRQETIDLQSFNVRRIIDGHVRQEFHPRERKLVARNLIITICEIQIFVIRSQPNSIEEISSSAERRGDYVRIGYPISVVTAREGQRKTIMSTPIPNDIASRITLNSVRSDAMMSNRLTARTCTAIEETVVIIWISDKVPVLTNGHINILVRTALVCNVLFV